MRLQLKVNVVLPTCFSAVRKQRQQSYTCAMSGGWGAPRNGLAWWRVAFRLDGL